MAISHLSRVPCDARTWITRHRRRFFPLISLSDSVPLPLTSYPLPLLCPVTSLSRPGVLVAYTLLRATGGRLSGSYLGTIWDIFWGQPGDILSISRVYALYDTVKSIQWNIPYFTSHVCINCNTRCSEVRSNSSMQYQSSARCMQWNAAN